MAPLNRSCTVPASRRTLGMMPAEGVDPSCEACWPPSPSSGSGAKSGRWHRSPGLRTVRGVNSDLTLLTDDGKIPTVYSPLREWVALDGHDREIVENDVEQRLGRLAKARLETKVLGQCQVKLHEADVRMARGLRKLSTAGQAAVKGEVVDLLNSSMCLAADYQSDVGAPMQADYFKQMTLYTMSLLRQALSFCLRAPTASAAHLELLYEMCQACGIDEASLSPFASELGGPPPGSPRAEAQSARPTRALSARSLSRSSPRGAVSAVRALAALSLRSLQDHLDDNYSEVSSEFDALDLAGPRTPQSLGSTTTRASIWTRGSTGESPHVGQYKHSKGGFIVVSEAGAGKLTITDRSLGRKGEERTVAESEFCVNGIFKLGWITGCRSGNEITWSDGARWIKVGGAARPGLTRSRTAAPAKLSPDASKKSVFRPALRSHQTALL